MLKRIFLSILFLAVAVIAFSHDYLLLPDEFFLKKGQHLVIHLLVGDELKDLEDKKYQSTKTTRFELLENGKKTDLRPITTDSIVPLLNRPLTSSGLALVVMERNASEIELDSTKFSEYLLEEGLSSISKKIAAAPKERYTERYTRYIKTLVCVDKPSGAYYSERLGEELEIILLQNPYKMQYGDDMVAQVWFRGKPLGNATVGVQTKGARGASFTTNYTSDPEGKIYFKLNRAGTWVVRLVQMLPSTDPTADFQSWWASYSFGFKG